MPNWSSERAHRQNKKDNPRSKCGAIDRFGKLGRDLVENRLPTAKVVKAGRRGEGIEEGRKGKGKAVEMAGVGGWVGGWEEEQERVSGSSHFGSSSALVEKQCFCGSWLLRRVQSVPGERAMGIG